MTPLPETGLIALVCYVPEQLFSTLQDIRSALNNSYDALPHITVLPPRPLRTPLGVVLACIPKILARHSAFAIELTQLSYFSATNILYLEVEHGSDHLRRLHADLNTGELKYPEAYEYTPHVTVSGPLEPDALPSLFETANALWARSASSLQFQVQELVLLWIGDGNTQWIPLRSFTLGGEQGQLATAANQT